MSDSTDNLESSTPTGGVDARHPDGRKTFFAKWSTTILCLSLFLVPLIVMGSLKSLKVYASDVRQWLPSGFEEAETYDKFQERFGVDEMVVISWEDCVIGNPQVLDFQRALIKQKLGDNPMFEKVLSGPDMLAQLGDLGVTNSKAKRRLAGLMIGPDNETTCILAYPFANLKTTVVLFSNASMKSQRMISRSTQRLYVQVAPRLMVLLLKSKARNRSEHSYGCRSSWFSS